MDVRNPPESARSVPDVSTEATAGHKSIALQPVQAPQPNLETLIQAAGPIAQAYFDGSSGFRVGKNISIPQRRLGLPQELGQDPRGFPILLPLRPTEPRVRRVGSGGGCPASD